MYPAYMQLLEDNFRKWYKLLKTANEYDDEDLCNYVLNELGLVSKNDWALLKEKADENLPRIL